MKLHLREIRCAGQRVRVVSLRPSLAVAFSTNFFHQTWHIVSNRRGSQLLARLLWGLSFQRDPHTVIAIQGNHIRPTPFGAEKSDPILIGLDESKLRKTKFVNQLRTKLRVMPPSQRTVRWQTHGLDAALAQDADGRARNLSGEQWPHQWVNYDSSKRLFEREFMSRVGGMVCYSAPPRVMRFRAVLPANLNPTSQYSDYVYVDESDRNYIPNGEIQVFKDYNERCSAAAEARKQVLAEKWQATDDATLYEHIAPRRDQIQRARRRQTLTRRSNIK